MKLSEMMKYKELNELTDYLVKNNAVPFEDVPEVLDISVYENVKRLYENYSDFRKKVYGKK